MSVHPIGTLFAILDGGTIVEIEELSALGVERGYEPDSDFVVADPHWQVGGTVIAGAYTAPPAPPAPLIIVYPVDLWSRMTDVEAEQVESAMALQPVRIQNIFKAASSYRSDHELWPLLESVAGELFGPARAADILAPSASAS